MTVTVEVTVTWRLFGGTLRDTKRGEVLEYVTGFAEGFGEEILRDILHVGRCFDDIGGGGLTTKAPTKRRAVIAKKIDLSFVLNIAVSREVTLLLFVNKIAVIDYHVLQIIFALFDLEKV